MTRGFKDIRKFFCKHEMHLKLIYLMRDPAERYYSALRMRRRDDSSYPSRQVFIKHLDDPPYYERGLYHVVLRNLRASFPLSDVYIGFYEHLFNHGEVERLCRFLELDYSVKADFSSKVNQSPAGTMTDEMRAAARERFADVYEFCRAEFGDDLPAAWNCR
jgi:hypothetical protein